MPALIRGPDPYVNRIRNTGFRETHLMVVNIHGVFGRWRTQEHVCPVEAGGVQDHEGEAEPERHPHSQGQQKLLRKNVA